MADELLRLFGGPRLIVAGAEADLGRPMQRRVLAALAVDAGSVVPTDALVDRVWDGTPPPSAHGSLQAHLTRVREALRRSGADMSLGRNGGGYILEAEPDAVDVPLFRRLRRGADVLGRGCPERVALLDRALALWTGPALAGLSGAWVDRVRFGLDQEVLETILAWGGDQLRLGRHDLVIPRLRRVREQFPRVELLAELLIRALHGAGRTSEAVEVYLALQQRLVHDLGTEPNRSLQAVYQALLRDRLTPPAEPAAVRVVLPEPATPIWSADHRSPGDARGRAPQVPRQLPAAATAFTGRERELRVLDAWLGPSRGALDPVAGPAAGPTRSATGTGTGTGTMVISVVSGMPGVGKTALALQWSHRVAGRFPDGQLYLNLRGYDPGQPITPTDALARLLHALGVPGPEVPASAEDRAALFRTRVADRRLLIVLDNAGTADQVRPLLPGSPTCAVIVTSRDPLVGLVARHGARRLDLGVLAPAEATRLVRRLIGRASDPDPAAVAQLTRRCRGLPLALRVAAELVVSSPGRPLRDLVGELDGSPRALDLFDAAGDSLTAVRAVFSWSYRHLSGEAARTFRLLGVAPAGQTHVAGAAAMCQADPAETRRHLDHLVRANLVQACPLRGHYTMHDLLRAYAAERAVETDGPQAVAAAQRRFLDHYLAMAVAAMDLVHPLDGIRRRAFGAPPSSGSAPFDTEWARRWLDHQAGALRDVISFAAVHSPDHALSLAATFTREIANVSPRTELITLFEGIVDLARRQGRRDTLVLALTMIATGVQDLGDRDGALRHLDEAMELALDTGDPVQQSHVLLHGAWVFDVCGKTEQAAELAQKALDLARRSGDVLRQVGALNQLGVSSYHARDTPAALSLLHEALQIVEPLQDAGSLAQTLTHLAEVQGESGQLGTALLHLQRALPSARHARSTEYESLARSLLARFLLRSGDRDASLRSSRDALRFARDAVDWYAESQALLDLADALRANGRTVAARRLYAKAIGIAARMGYAYVIDQARGRLQSLGDVQGTPA